MNAKLIVLNGKTYRSIEEMPTDVREKYELAMCLLGNTDESESVLADQNKNGIADLLEKITTSSVVTNDTKIIIDGKEFNGIENLPPEARARYEEAMRKLDANRNGVPDFVEGLINATNQTTNVSTSFEITPPALAPSVVYPPTAGTPQGKPLPADSAITPDTSNGWMLALAGVFILLLCVAGAAGVWYFFLR